MRVSVFNRHATALLAAVGWAPRAVTPAVRAASCPRRLGIATRDAPDCTILAIALGEGIVSLAVGA
jgi:hypothetical protein